MGLHELPVELIHRIFVQCDVAEIRILRAVNKLCLAVANEYFLSDIKLFLLMEDYGAISKLVDNPGIRKGVRSLTLQADLFDDADYKS